MTNYAETDRDIVELCLRAFKVIPRADDSRKFLKRELDIEAGAYAGNRSHILAAEMVKLLEAHLKESSVGLAEDAHGRLE